MVVAPVIGCGEEGEVDEDDEDEGEDDGGEAAGQDALGAVEVDLGGEA